VQVNGDQKYCGENFPDVRSTWKPYTLNVNFDNREIPPFPFGTSPGYIEDSASCLALGTATGNLFTCTWYPGATANSAVGECQCDPNAAILSAGVNPALLFGGTPDSNNTGFCLRYQM